RLAPLPEGVGAEELRKRLVLDVGDANDLPLERDAAEIGTRVRAEEDVDVAAIAKLVVELLVVVRKRQADAMDVGADGFEKRPVPLRAEDEIFVGLVPFEERAEHSLDELGEPSGDSMFDDAQIDGDLHLGHPCPIRKGPSLPGSGERG